MTKRKRLIKTYIERNYKKLRGLYKSRKRRNSN